MKYQVLVSETPIPFESKVQLENLGLFVPYLNTDDSFNIYAYIPEGLEVKIRDINRVHTFEDITLWITEKELEQFAGRIKSANSVEVGDLVKFRNYKNLVTKIEKIQGDTVTTSISLRGYVFRFKQALAQVKKSDLVYVNKEGLSEVNHNNNLFVDLSEFHNLCEPEIYYNEVFTLLFRLKLKYSNLNLVLYKDRYNLAESIGLPTLKVEGTLVEFLQSQLADKNDFIYSDLSNYSDNLNFIIKTPIKNGHAFVCLNHLNFKQYTGFNDSKSYYLFRHAQKQSQNNTNIFDPVRLTTEINNDYERFLKRFGEPELAQVTDVKSTIETHTVCYEELFEWLKANKLVYIAENLDYYLNLLRG